MLQTLTIVELLESERRDIRCQTILGRNFRKDLDSIDLIFNHAHNHTLKDQISLA